MVGYQIGHMIFCDQFVTSFCSVHFVNVTKIDYHTVVASLSSMQLYTASSGSGMFVCGIV